MNTIHARRQHGFSLIELMVAITIGMILTMLIGQIFINSRMVFSSTDSLGRVQENARYALLVLTRGIRTSTYKSDPRVPRSTVFPIGTLASLGGLDGGTTGTPASGLPDLLMVRFQGANGSAGVADGTIQDCAGNRIAAGAMVVNTFFIKNDPANNNEPTLYCTLETPGVACTTTATCAPCTASTTCFPLVPGVENLQVIYGEDKVGAPPATLSPDGSIDKFGDASTVTNWDNVLTVRVSLLMRTDDRVANTATPSTVAYSMVGTNVYAPGTDTRLRRVFTTVIDLRNRTQ
jgi:type IV pilus assembly protein PilW